MGGVDDQLTGLEELLLRILVHDLYPITATVNVHYFSRG